MEDQNQDSQRMKFVLLVVLILCGGNGIGIITGALVWKFTGSIAGAILTAVVITVVALICALALVLSHNKKRKK